MATLVSVEPYSGTLRRYEVGGASVRLSHMATTGKRETFSAAVVEQFRLMPDPRFAVDPPPRPTNPPSGVGTARLPRAA